MSEYTGGFTGQTKTLYIIIGIVPLEDEEPAWEEVGYTLVYDNEELLQKHFPESEYIEVEAPIGGMTA